MRKIDGDLQSDADIWTSGAYRSLSVDGLMQALRKDLDDGPQGKLDALEVLVKEIAAQKAELQCQNQQINQAHAELRRNRDALDELYNEAPVGYVTTSMKGDVIQANRTLLNSLGLAAADVVGQSFGSLVAADSQRQYRELHQQLFGHKLEVQHPIVGELVLRNAAAQRIHARLQCTRSFDKSLGVPVAQIAIIDISSEHAAKRALADERKLADQLLNTAHVMVLMLDNQGRILQINRYLERLSGFSLAEVKGKYWSEVFAYPKDAERALAGFSSQRSPTHGWSLTLDLRTRDGTRKSVEWRNTRSMRGDSRTAESVLCVGIDVTEISELRQREREQMRVLSHIGRLTIVEQLSTQIAHELNQPLTAIINYCRVMAMHLQNPGANIEKLKEILDRIGKQAKRSSQTIKRLRRFAARRAPERSRIDLNLIVRRALSLSKVGSLGGVDEVELDLSPDLPEVEADALLIEQVVANLISNGLEAMVDLPSRDRRLKIATTFDTQEVEIRVEDSGPGVSGAELEQIYQGFYTTKPEGLGLGLVISRSIVESHNGRLSARRTAWGGGQSGMCFSVHLPLGGA